MALVAATFVASSSARRSGARRHCIGLGAAVFARAPVRQVVGGARGPALIAVLGETGRLQLAFGALTTLGLLLGGWID